MKNFKNLKLFCCLTFGVVISFDLAASSIINFIKKHPVITAFGIAAIPASTFVYNQWCDFENFSKRYDLTKDFIGERAFCDVCPPEGLTREEWYKQKMAGDEACLKAEILKLLKISPEKFQECCELSKREAVETENKKRASQEDICCKYNVAMTDGSTIEDEIKQDDLDMLHEILRYFEFENIEILTRIAFDTSDNISFDDCAAIALSNCIEIYPRFLVAKTHASCLMAIRHELSHIAHQDYVWSNAFKYYFKTYLLNDDQQGLDQTKLKMLGVTKNDVAQASYMFDYLNKVCIERRADLEAVLAVKDHPIFKEAIKNELSYNGYPFRYKFDVGYENYSKVAYIQDFFKGIENDYKRSINKQ